MIQRHAGWRHLRQGVLAATSLWLLGACIIAATGIATRPQPAELALVLGNTVDRVNRPLPRLEARLQAAQALYQRGGCGTVMVSGGVDSSDGRDEAIGMRDWLVAHGVPAQHIVVDSSGDNTRASALHAQAWLAAHGQHRVVVVSQYFHLPRARLALRQAGAEDAGGDYPRRWFIRDVYSSLREVPGYLAYWVGWS
ncbi:YdcF family protein [Dyella tabacisoli]|uniref:YdcF family protein n=1 Tax=Dyella tabacisoli TaxID=2282381 RepID=UPI001CDC54D8|nr:YdcF family protein [Dyella tabacisoli]